MSHQQMLLHQLNDVFRFNCAIFFCSSPDCQSEQCTIVLTYNIMKFRIHDRLEDDVNNKPNKTNA